MSSLLDQVAILHQFADERIDLAQAQSAHETLDALVATGKPVTVDEILPDPHRIAALREPKLDRLPVHLAGTRGCPANLINGHC